MTNKIERHDNGRLPAGRIKDNVDTSQGKREKGILEKRDSLRKGTTSKESHRIWRDYLEVWRCQSSKSSGKYNI